MLIVVILAGLGAFYFKTDPGRLGENHNLAISSSTPDASDVDSTLVGSGGAVQTDARPMLIEHPIEEALIPLPGEPTLIASGSPDEDFASWMTPLTLDNYIRQKNGSHNQSFWQRGHWMSAVEGR